MSLIDLASLVLSPTATKEGKVYSAIPDTGDGDMTFSRGSGATRVNSAGLIEKERGNLLTYSNDFSNWSQTRNTVTSNTTTAPDGTTTADKIAASSTFVTNTSRVYQNTTVSGVNTISVYAKPNEITEMLLYGLGANNGIYFDLDNGSFLSYDSGTTNIVDYNINNEGNGWYRYSITFSVTITRYQIYLSKNENYVNNFTEGEGFFLWNAQAENGLVAQSYIETTTSAVYEGITDDVPRVDYSGGGCPSLLLEPSRTNSVGNSELINPTIDFTWKQIGSNTFTNNYGISPEGNQNSTLIEFGGTSASYQVYYQINFSAGQYTTSIYAKGSGSFKLGFYDNSSVLTDTINLTSEWQRFEVTKTLSATTYGRGVWLYPNGDGDTIEVWGAQVEAGSYSTSYIPTYSVSSTRVADSCSKTGISSLIGQSEGTLFVEVDLSKVPSENRRFLAIGDGTVSNRIGIGQQSGTSLESFVVASGSLQAIFTQSGTTAQVYKIAIAYASNDFVMYVDGSQVGTDTSGSVPSTSNVYVGVSEITPTTTQVSDGITQAILFPTRLTNDQLEELTK